MPDPEDFTVLPYTLPECDWVGVRQKAVFPSFLILIPLIPTSLFPNQRRKENTDLVLFSCGVGRSLNLCIASFARRKEELPQTLSWSPFGFICCSQVPQRRLLLLSDWEEVIGQHGQASSWWGDRLSGRQGAVVASSPALLPSESWPKPGLSDGRTT